VIALELTAKSCQIALMQAHRDRWMPSGEINQQTRQEERCQGHEAAEIYRASKTLSETVRIGLEFARMGKQATRLRGQPPTGRGRRQPPGMVTPEQ